MKPFPPFSFNTHLTFPPKHGPLKKINKTIKVTSYLQLDKSNRYISVSHLTKPVSNQLTQQFITSPFFKRFPFWAFPTPHSTGLSLCLWPFFLCRLSSPTFVHFRFPHDKICSLQFSIYIHPFSYIISSVPLVLILTIDHKPKFIISKPNLYHELWIYFIKLSNKSLNSN